MSQVVLIRCEDYNIENVRRAVTRGLDLLGGAGAFAKKGSRVLLKPNLLVGEIPEKCVNTHPSVFRSVAELFVRTGAAVSYGDSPGFGSAAAAAKKCGIQNAALELNVPEADFANGIEVFFEPALQNKKFVVAKAVTENDVIISLPKLKTHGFQKFTGAVKNQFGCIPGVRKGEYHLKLQDPESFAQMLLDLNKLVKPALYVMDGIHAMEGNGPRGGKPRAMHVLLFSTDPIALDATACRMIDVNPDLVPTIRIGHRTGTGTSREEEIELLGDDFTGFRQPGFDIDRKPLKPYRSNGMVRFVTNRLVPKPYIVKDRCTRCGMCVSICPTCPKSVDWLEGGRERPPAHNYRTCIRCYCCQEICPEGAIELDVPFIRRITGID